MKLEVVVVPVFDVEQAKDLYQAPRGALLLGVLRVRRDYGPDPPPVCVRNPDGSPVLDSVPVTVDITDAALS